MTPDRTRWCELLVGLEGVEVLDVVREGERLVLLHEPFRAALSHHLPDATAVADPFHVVAVRHAAPCSRGRVRDPPLRPVAAGR